MRRWFLSYHSPDQALAERLKAAIERKDVASRVFFAPTHLRAGGSWSAQLSQEISQANGFILLIGKSGIGKWQVPEYYEAHDRWVNAPTEFPLVVVLLEGQSAPGLPFLRQLHWIITPDPASEKDVARLFDAAAGDGSSPSDLWRYTSPYRGLAAMEEKDSDYFFGRERETIDVLSALAGASDRVPVLIGNSGVGKSSLAQAGVLAALKRQAWPENEGAPDGLAARICRQPALVLSHFAARYRAGARAGRGRFSTLGSLTAPAPNGRPDAPNGLRHCCGESSLARPARSDRAPVCRIATIRAIRFLLYIDQGEELYVRSLEGERRHFSEILAGGLSEPRLRCLMSMRADFFGELQKDQALDEVSRKTEVKPLRKAQLLEVVNRPAELLSAHFENDHLAGDIAQRAAEEFGQGCRRVAAALLPPRRHVAKHGRSG